MPKQVMRTIWFILLTAMGSNAEAQNFYAGKQLTVLINYEAGGPTDIEARAFARHIGKHIPGNPSIIAQNMGGAAGLVGAKYLGEVAPRDGSILGYFDWLLATLREHARALQRRLPYI